MFSLLFHSINNQYGLANTKLLLLEIAAKNHKTEQDLMTLNRGFKIQRL